MGHFDESDKQDICSHCNTYIITNDSLQSQASFRLWLNNTGILEGTARIPNDIKTRCYEDFLRLFSRMIFLSSMIIQEETVTPWMQITGDDSNYICSGMTEACDSKTEITLKDAIDRPHDAAKILYCTPQQQELLSSNGPNHLVIFGDFGTGKKNKLTSTIQR